MHEHDAAAYADASTEHHAPAYATYERTDALTQMYSPNAESSANASPAGGQNESLGLEPCTTCGRRTFACNVLLTHCGQACCGNCNHPADERPHRDIASG